MNRILPGTHWYESNGQGKKRPCQMEPVWKNDSYKHTQRRIITHSETNLRELITIISWWSCSGIRWTRSIILLLSEINWLSWWSSLSCSAIVSRTRFDALWASSGGKSEASDVTVPFFSTLSMSEWACLLWSDDLLGFDSTRYNCICMYRSVIYWCSNRIMNWIACSGCLRRIWGFTRVWVLWFLKNYIPLKSE